MAASAWPSDWLRATLPLAVLASLAAREDHGYALMARLRDVGLTDIKGATLYPLLARQEQAGLVEHRWEHAGSGPARKVFHLTAAGRTELHQLQRNWHQFTAMLAVIVPSDSGDVTP